MYSRTSHNTMGILFQYLPKLLWKVWALQGKYIEKQDQVDIHGTDLVINLLNNVASSKRQNSEILYFKLARLGQCTLLAPFFYMITLDYIFR